MKKVSCIFALIFSFAFIACATIELTPGRIEDDIRWDRLTSCQYYLSTKVVLTYSADTRQTDLNRLGIVRASQRAIRKKITIKESTPGIFKTLVTSENRDSLTLYILFDRNNENVMEFKASQKGGKFELVSDRVIFDGSNYNVTYAGKEEPHLKYKLIERSKAKSTSRKARGRRVNRNNNMSVPPALYLGESPANNTLSFDSDEADENRETSTLPLQRGTYTLAGPLATTISFSAIAKEGNFSYTNWFRRNGDGKYSIDGNRLTIRRDLDTASFEYTIGDDQTSFSNDGGEKWNRTGPP